MAVPRDFLHLFFQESNPSGPPNKQVKMDSLKIHFRGDIREISDYAQANNAQSQTLCRLTLCGVLPAPNPKLAATVRSRFRAG